MFDYSILGNFFSIIILFILALMAGKAIANWYYEVKTRNKLQKEILQELREIKKIMKPEENKTENEL